MSSIAIIACVSLTQESAPKYIEAAKALIEPTRAEPGCEFYGMAVDIADPTKVWISEQWSSLDLLNAHLQTDQIRDFIAYSATLEVLDMDARQYDVSGIGPVIIPE